MKLRIGRKKKLEGLVVGKCRFCGKIFAGRAIKDEPKSFQIITCKDCLDKLPRDDYLDKFLRKKAIKSKKGI